MLEDCGPCLVFVGYTLAFALSLRKKHVISFTVFSAPVFSLIQWFFSLSSFVIIYIYIYIYIYIRKLASIFLKLNTLNALPPEDGGRLPKHVVVEILYFFIRTFYVQIVGF